MGFGRFANTHIPADQLELLPRNLVLSHTVGVGEPISRPVVRLLMTLKLSSLGRGHSGIRREVIDALITLFNADVLPVIPVKGSVGAPGDLAPLQRVEYRIEASVPPEEIRPALAMAEHAPCLLLHRRTWLRDAVASVANLWHLGDQYQFTGDF